MISEREMLWHEEIGLTEEKGLHETELWFSLRSNSLEADPEMLEEVFPGETGKEVRKAE